MCCTGETLDDSLEVHVQTDCEAALVAFWIPTLLEIALHPIQRVIYSCIYTDLCEADGLESLLWQSVADSYTLQLDE